MFGGLFEKKKGPLVCSFCGQTQLQVAKLITGNGANICDRCVRMSADIVVESTPDALPEARLLGHVIGELKELVVPPYEQVRRLAAAGLSLRPDEKQRRELGLRVGGWVESLGIEIYKDLPAESTTTHDRIQVATWYMELENYAASVHELSLICEPTTASVQLQVRVGRAACWVRLRSADEMEPLVAALDADLSELSEMGDQVAEDFRIHTRRRARLAQALARVKLGQLAEAESLLDGLLQEDPWNRFALWHKSELRQAAGDPKAAEHLRATLLSLLHPESVMGRRLRASTA